jgi:alpha-galactosidase
MTIRTSERGWILETAHTGYALGVSPQGLLVNRYWGARLPYAEDYPAAVDANDWASFSGSAHLSAEEYPGYGGTKYIEPCLKVTFADGVRDVVLRFDSAEVREGETPELDIHLKDAYYPLSVTLHYRVHPQYDLIERWTTLVNTGDSLITLERVWSAQWHLPRGDAYRMAHLTGRWVDEMHIRREALVQGVKVLESRRLTTSHHNNPWFAVDRGTATEQSGEVWFGALAWSGNWKLAAEVTDFQSTRINLGINDWDFAWHLQPGDNFSTQPATVCTTSSAIRCCPIKTRSIRCCTTRGKPLPLMSIRNRKPAWLILPPRWALNCLLWMMAGSTIATWIMLVWAIGGLTLKSSPTDSVH